jgi:hypothetical protein
MVTTRCALILTVLAFLVVPAIASAVPTATNVSSPASPAFVNVDLDNPGTLHVAGTTSGGTGDVDLRCYSGTAGPLVKAGVTVTNGAFATDVTLTETLINTLGESPEPYCILRAVPTGSVPAAAPGSISPWTGPFVGWGQSKLLPLGAGFGDNTDQLSDYFISRAQASALNDFDSIASCGLCDTWLYKPGDKTPSKPIWWSNAALFSNPDGVSGRTAVRIDGVDAYSGYSAYASYGLPGHHMADNPGFPGVTESHSIDPANGNLTIEEHAAYRRCAENPSLFPPTAVSCQTFGDTGVQYERTIRTTDNGLRVTIVDRWKSVDGKSHQLDAIYEDVMRSENAATAGHEGVLNFPWVDSSFTGYAVKSEIPLPPSAPASMFVKTDGSTPNSGDSMNPIGGVTFGTRPSKLVVNRTGDASNFNGAWLTHYDRSIPAGGEISIATAYSHDYGLNSVKAKATELEAALAAPTVSIDSPADGTTVDAATAHVTGQASSPDGQLSVKVNGVAATVGAGGDWSADVPLNEGSNLIVAVASNASGVTASASHAVTRPSAAAAAPVAEAPSAPAAAPVPVIAAKPLRCIVPKLKGKTLAKAKRLLKRAHCRLGKVSRKASTRVKSGRVIKTHLKPGSRVRAGARVRLTLAKKPAAV